jgi:hypothetical protein
VRASIKNLEVKASEIFWLCVFKLVFKLLGWLVVAAPFEVVECSDMANNVMFLFAIQN